MNLISAMSQKETLAQQGYLALRGVFDAEEVAQLRALSDAMTASAEAVLTEVSANGGTLGARAQAHPEELIVVSEADDPTKLCRYEYLMGHSAAFSAFVEKTVLPVAETILAEPVAVFKDKTNEKAPGGGAFGPHQDHEAYKSFGPGRFVTALISIDPATRANGAMEFAPNYKSLAAHDPQAQDFDGYPLFDCVDGGPQHGEVVPDIAAQLEWEMLETSPADLVLFDSFVPHRSAVNASAQPRRAIFITMNVAREGALYARYYAEKRSNYDDPKFHVATPTAREGR
ncbi:MAG: phytanoyl-CoA dioxygenase family protein [Pseudomonadota bacterium]